jgi:hypothetical protein
MNGSIFIFRIKKMFLFQDVHAVAYRVIATCPSRKVTLNCLHAVKIVKLLCTHPVSQKYNIHTMLSSSHFPLVTR